MMVVMFVVCVIVDCVRCVLMVCVIVEVMCVVMVMCVIGLCGVLDDYG